MVGAGSTKGRGVANTSVGFDTLLSESVSLCDYGTLHIYNPLPYYE